MTHFADRSSQRVISRLSETDLRAVSLPARLAVRWRRSHGDPTSAVEADELHDLIGPSPFARFIGHVIVIVSLAVLAGTAYMWMRGDRLAEDRATVHRIIHGHR